MIGTLLRIRYEILQELEEGPIFKALRVRDRVGGRELKCRMIQPPFSGEASFLEALRNVISDTRAYEHPGLEKLLELDEHEGTPFLVSELSTGAQLQDKIRKLAPFSSHVSITTAIGVLEALTAMHDLDQAHGDIESSNVFVTQDGKVKLALPGVWKAYGASNTAGGVVLPGMASYLAPEITQGEMPSPRSDIYAVGSLLFELLTGRYPFSADTPIAMAMKHATNPVPSAKAQNPGVHIILEEIIKKMMAKLPADRYANAREALHDLRILQDALRFGKPISWPIKLRGPIPEPTPVDQPVLVAPKMSAIRKEPATPKQPTPANEPEPAEPYDGLPKFILAGAYIMVLGLIALVAMILYQNLTAPTKVRVPNLVNRNAMQAEQDLKKLGLVFRTESVVSDKPEGTILLIEPPADTKISVGESVKAKVSIGRKFVEVPDVLGLSVREARDLITKANLKVVEKAKASRNFEKGQVIEQNPPARQQLERESTVTLYVSNGKRTGGGEERGPRMSYKIEFELDADEALRVRVDLIDSTGTAQVYEQDHAPGDLVTFEATGYGESVIFKIFYDGEFVYQKTARAEVTEEETTEGGNP
jgi:serine/threonine protein kinase